MLDNIEEINLPRLPFEFRIHNLDTLKVLCDATRMKIIRSAVNQPVTVQQIAEVLEVPFMRLYYHIKMLIDHNLLRVVYTKKMPGAIEEKYYQTTACAFTVDHSLLAFVSPDEVRQYFSRVEDARRDLVGSIENGKVDHVQQPPHPDALLLLQAKRRISKSRSAEFHNRLIALYEEFSTSTESPDEEDTYALFLLLHPVE